jgi:hypothetical protein
MGPKFYDPVLRGNDLEVSGPFETHGAVVDDVLVRFVISSGPTAPSIIGTATIDKATLDPLTAIPTGLTGADELEITRGTFSATVSNTSGLNIGDKVRGIGIAVVLKGAPSPEPPAFETFTWCVNLVVKAP